MAKKPQETFTESDYAVVRGADIPADEKEALIELMDELIAEGWTKERILVRMSAAVKVEIEHAEEFAAIGREVDRVFGR